jgi:hypothetical protein
MKRWVLYVLLLGFATYWASNLLLWFPWTYSATLGITLMLTATPLLWAYSSVLALKTYPKDGLLRGGLIIALVFLLLAAVMDYIFFGQIRNAMEELYHPTTFYGYGFLLFWPLVLVSIFRNQISKWKKNTASMDLIKAGFCGMICFGILTVIIFFGIEI